MFSSRTDDIVIPVLMPNGEVHCVTVDYQMIGGIVVILNLGNAPVIGIDACAISAVQKFVEDYREQYA